MEKHSFITERANVAEVGDAGANPDQDDSVEQRISDEWRTRAAALQLQTASQRTT
jgi:hypothetical protein